MKFAFGLVSIFSILVIFAGQPTYAANFSTMLGYQDSIDNVMYMRDQFQLPTNGCAKDRKTVDAENVEGVIRSKMTEMKFPIKNSVGIIVANHPDGFGPKSYDDFLKFLNDNGLVASPTSTAKVNVRLTCEYEVCAKTYGTAVFYNTPSEPKCLLSLSN